MALNISDSYCSDVSITYILHQASQNIFSLSGVMTITCINLNKAPSAMSVLIGLQNQGGINYRVGDDNRIHLRIAQGIDVTKLVDSVVKALEAVGCTTSVFNNS
jgi:hypothetical protein